jgi:hypothetical protein
MLPMLNSQNFPQFNSFSNNSGGRKFVFQREAQGYAGGIMRSSSAPHFASSFSNLLFNQAQQDVSPQSKFSLNQKSSTTAKNTAPSRSFQNSVTRTTSRFSASYSRYSNPRAAQNEIVPSINNCETTQPSTPAQDTTPASNCNPSVVTPPAQDTTTPPVANYPPTAVTPPAQDTTPPVADCPPAVTTPAHDTTPPVANCPPTAVTPPAQDTTPPVADCSPVVTTPAQDTTPPVANCPPTEPTLPPVAECPPAPVPTPPPSYDGGCDGSYWGDPHLVGFDGEKYDVMGQSGKTYNMISDKNLQYNTEFADFGTGNGATVIGAAGIQVGNNKVALDAKTKSATVDGIAMTVGQKVTLDKAGSATWDGSSLAVTSSEYSINLTVKKDPNGTDYLDSAVKITGNPFGDNVKPHGLLGQTADGVAGAKDTGIDQGKQGGTVIDGTVSDYEVSGLFDTAFQKNNRYNG